MKTKHRDIFHDWVDRCYHCSFCGKYWADDEPEPDCMTGHEKAKSLLDSIKSRLNNERRTKQSSNR